MRVGWLFKKRKRLNRFDPKDKVSYIVAADVVAFTEMILKEYGHNKPAAEGVVYWCGAIDGQIHYIHAAVAPKTTATRYGFATDHQANARFLDYISELDLVYLAQVHSHPSEWVDHSGVDDEETAFRSEGLVSIVVPHFSEHGILPFKQCGVHRYAGGRFKRLADKYIKKHFTVKKNIDVHLKDQRDE